MVNWKTDRRVQFAIGLAVVIVAAKWLFTGSLFYAAVDMSQSPAEGQTRAGAVGSAVLPIVFDVVIGALIYVGSWTINLAELLFGRVRNLAGDSEQASPSSAATAAVATSEVPVSLDSPGSMKRAADALIDAAAANDRERGDQLWSQIRKPYALAELNDAYVKGDTEAAAALVDELNKMHAVHPSPSARGKRGGGNSNAS